MKYKILAWPMSKNCNSNPYQYLLYSELNKYQELSIYEFSLSNILFGSRPNIIHLHWPDAYLASATGFMFWIKLFVLRLMFLYARFRGISTVWTAHNLMRSGQRNGERMERYFWPWFVKNIDYLIYMNAESKARSEQMFEGLSNKPNAIIPHGDYTPIIEKYSPQELKCDSELKQILFFGSISNYKGATNLLDAFLMLPNGYAQLAIRGKMSKVDPDEKLMMTLDELSEENKKYVLFEDKFLDDPELIHYIYRSDLVVFPYEQVMNSGAAIFALSVGTPILVSDIPLFRELQTQIGSDWVYLMEDALDGDTLIDALDKATEFNCKSRMPDLSKLDWSVIAKQTFDAYKELLVASSGNDL